MQKHRQILSKYPLSLLCMALICYLSLFYVPPVTPLSSVAFIDKWTHLVMYGGTCTVIWTEYLRCHRRCRLRRAALWAWLAPILMSGVLELLQAYCTTNRTGEWLDLAANATGATIGAFIGWGIKTHRERKG